MLCLTYFLPFSIPSLTHLVLDFSLAFDGLLPAATLPCAERLATAKRRQRGNGKVKEGWRKVKCRLRRAVQPLWTRKEGLPALPQINYLSYGNRLHRILVMCTEFAYMELDI